MRGDGRLYRRGRVWWIAYCHNGQEVRESTGTTDERKAQKALRARIQQVANDSAGIQSFHPKATTLTVGNLLDALEQDYTIRGKLSASTKSHLKRIRTHFGTIRALTLDAATIDTYIAEQLESRAPATINRGTQLLTQAYNLAIKRGTIGRKPYVRKLPEQNTRQGFFEPEEFSRILEHLPEYLQDAARFAYLSGWRRGEVFTLEWTDIDIQARVARLRPEHSKNGHGRTLALVGELLSITERRLAARHHTRADEAILISRYVFHRQGARIGDIKKAWKKACTAAGVPDRLFHDLRRTAVRNMVRAGVPESVAMKVTGHRTRAVFDRYNIVDERDVREAMEKTQKHLNAIYVR
jgi:integrase